MRDRPHQRNGQPMILTPDQRLRIFVSSTLQELAEERQAVREAIHRLRLAPVMFELGARPHPAHKLYRAYLAQSHIFIGIYWQSYGWVAPGAQISGLEDEYNLSANMPLLLYIKEPAPNREPALTRLLDRIRDENASCYKFFSTPDELRELVENDVVVLLTEFFETALGEGVPSELAPTAMTNVPVPRNPLLGRDQELETACRLLLREDVGLVTLIGPAGAGKSRLGIQVALDVRDHFRDGVYMVGLESISDPDLMIPTVAKTLGLTERTGELPLGEMLKGHLRDKQVLLLLDNFEQLLPAAPRIAELLEAGPQAKIVATSRTSLHLRAEKELPVLPLPLPPLNEGLGPEALSQYAAVQLFAQRAQGVRPGFQLTVENAPAVAEICHRLDGLPLAIELASARLRVLTPQALLARLKHRFEVLRGGTRDLPERQHTLYRAIDWSYNLLGEHERRLFRWLSVFAGGWAYEAADAICNAQGEGWIEVYDGLESLMDCNLLKPLEEVDGELRFGMLETIRDFAQERLDDSGEAEAMRHRHAQYFLSLAEHAGTETRQVEQQVWLRRLEAELDNLRTALGWAVEQCSDELALRLCGALGQLWEVRGHLNEGRRWIDQALACHSQAPAPFRIKALSVAGRLAFEQRDLGAAQAFYEEGLALAQESADPTQIASLLNNLGNVAWAQADVGRAGDLYDQVLALHRQQQDKRGIARVLNNLGLVAMRLRQYERAAQLMEESALLTEDLGDQQGLANTLFNLGLVTVRVKDGARRASDHFAACVELCRKLGYRRIQAYALNNLAMLALHEGDEALATSLAQESLELCRLQEDWLGAFYALINLSHAALDRGDPRQGACLLDEALTLLRQAETASGHQPREEIAWFLQGIVHLAVSTGQLKDAVQLAGADAALREAADGGLPPSASAYHKTLLAEAQSRLSGADFAEAWATGQATSAEQACRQAHMLIRGPQPLSALPENTRSLPQTLPIVGR